MRAAFDELRRDAWKREHILSLSREELLALGKERARIHAENAKAYEAKATLERERQDREAKEPATAQASEPAADLAKLATPIAEELGLDESGAKKLAQFVDQVAETRSKAMTERANSLAQQFTAVEGVIKALVGELTRRSLREELPGLEVAETFAKVARKVDELARDPDLVIEGSGLERVENLYREAYSRVTPRDETTSNPKQQQAARQRANGSPARPTARTQAPATTDLEHIERVIEAHNAGLSRDEILRRSGARPIRRT